MTQTSTLPSTPASVRIQDAMDIINDNQAHRRSARAAQLEALEAGASPEEASRVFAEVLDGAPPPEARMYVQRAMEMLNVTPEGFMVLLQTQVEREDQKVLESRNSIEAAIAKSRELSERMSVLQQIHQRLSQESDGNLNMRDGDITVNGRIMNIGEAVVEFGLEQELNLTEHIGGQNWPGGVLLREESVQSAIDALRQEQQTVTSANELNMIAMQQAMQQRGQHLQLVSKVLAMMGDTERAIVGNMR
jgi:hypothetical protein